MAIIAQEELRLDLTDREMEVLGLVLAGQTMRAVASSLSCSERTVSRALAGIYAKLRVQNKSQAIPRARLLGFQPLDGQRR